MACGYCAMGSRMSKGQSFLDGTLVLKLKFCRVTITAGITALETRGSYGVSGARMGWGV